MKYITILLISIAFLQGCYYDNKDFLDPGTATCDTAIITYSASVRPVLTAYCVSCHSGANAPLGIMLDTYAGVKVQASNGKLVGTVTHAPGVSPMPKNSAMLSDCNIIKIRKWVAAGAPNN